MQLQYIGPLARVLIERPGMNRLAVDAFEPLPVFRTQAEASAAGLENPKRWVPLKTAQRLVEHGGGVWAWVDEPTDAPAPILSGPLPDGFPHADALRQAGFGALELVPRSRRTLALLVPGLIQKVAGNRPSRAELAKAADEVLDALDALIRAGGNG
jgi:hypothetical protein